MSQDEKRLNALLAQLGTADRATLLAFAEFLAARAGVSDAPVELATPTPLPRPAEESVVAAIKRLSVSYHMVDRSKMLHETAALMSQHVMQGRAAEEVIDELELLFQHHYEKQAGSRD